jgi:hypothetical protein
MASWSEVAGGRKRLRAMGICMPTVELSPQRAAQELLKRRSIRLKLSDWARHKGFEPARHHRLIISEIESFLESDDEVLLLFAPPGSAKSSYVSVLLPSWYLANNPTHSILAATHSVELPSAGVGGFATISQLMGTCWVSSYRKIARRQLVARKCRRILRRGCRHGYLRLPSQSRRRRRPVWFA